jgi:hypothetical protein
MTKRESHAAEIGGRFAEQRQNFETADAAIRRSLNHPIACHISHEDSAVLYEATQILAKLAQAHDDEAARAFLERVWIRNENNEPA